MGIRRRFAGWWRAYNSRRALGESYREVAEKAVEELVAPEQWAVVVALVDGDKFRDALTLFLPGPPSRRGFEDDLARSLGWDKQMREEMGVSRDEFMNEWVWDVTEIRCAGLELGRATRPALNGVSRRRWEAVPRDRAGLGLDD